MELLLTLIVLKREKHFNVHKWSLYFQLFDLLQNNTTLKVKSEKQKRDSKSLIRLEITQNFKHCMNLFLKQEVLNKVMKFC